MALPMSWGPFLYRQLQLRLVAILVALSRPRKRF